jgi:hypothetical protein
MRFLLSIVLIVILGAGCASGKKEKPDPLTLSTPLPLDPTDTYEIAEWWTNGKQLLQLSETGVYRLHDGINRYRTPIERGRCRVVTTRHCGSSPTPSFRVNRHASPSAVSAMRWNSTCVGCSR